MTLKRTSLTGLGLTAALSFMVGMSAAARATDRIDPADLNYIGSVQFMPEAGELTASWTIQILDEEREEIEFGLNSLLGPAVVSGDPVEAVAMTVDPVDPMIRRYRVKLKPQPVARARVVQFFYGGPLFGREPGFSINSLDAEKIELTVDSFWFPFDMRFDSRITATVGARVPDVGSWSAVGVDRAEQRSRGFSIQQRRPALDIAFSLLARSEIVTTENYVIHDARSEPGTRMTELNETLQSCTAFLNDLAGPAGPLPRASILVTDRAEGAYARGTLIALTDIENDFGADLQKFICHELAHYWSYANAGGPENWINEGVADYIALMAVRDILGVAAFETFLSDYRERLTGRDLPPIWTPDATDRPPYLISYRAAPLALYELEVRMGEAAFRDLMRAVMVDRLRTTPELLTLVERLSDQMTRHWFEMRLAE